VLGVRARGVGAPRRRSRQLARHAAPEPVPPVARGRARPRPGTERTFATPTPVGSSC